MTRHASRHANSVTIKSNHTLNSVHTRNPWLADQNYSGNVFSSNSLQRERLPFSRTLSGPGPPRYRESVVETHTKCYPQNHAKSMTMPHLKGPKMYSSYVQRVPPARVNITAVPVTNSRPLLFDHVSAVNSGCSTSRTSSDRPITPVSLSTTDGIVDPCGGHCRTFERCCHHLLQILFAIGILVGVSLVIAAFWLHNQLVLVYIGVLMALVCILLLSIQCSVDREVKRKKRSRRATTILLSRNRSHSEVPMRNLDGSRFAYASRNTDDTIPNPNTYCEIPLLCNPYHHETQQRSCDEMSQSQNGIPWWRRYELEVTSKNDNIV
ncbi:hypothetical protein PGB90_006411 [Kerria lacca]